MSSAEGKGQGAVYVCIAEGSMSPGLVALIRSNGYEFHHFIASTRELVYYKWAHPTMPNMVPAFATSVEGAHAIVLSPDQTQVLLVEEYGRWSGPGGAIDPAECMLDGLAREVREEVGLTVDLAFEPVLVLAKQNAAFRDGLINNNW